MEIKITGNKSIESETIKIYGDLDKYNNFDDKSLSEILKKIYNTGFFSDVKISYTNDILEIIVQETPIIKKIEFNGTKAIGKEQILEEFATKEKKFFSKTDILSDNKRLSLVYQKLGYLNVKIRPLIKFLDDGAQVVVIFDVKEGKKTQIDSIQIEGNKIFNDKTIKDDALKIRERTLWKFNLGASFDIESVKNEQENIKKFYQTKGFPKIEIKNIVSKFDKKNNLFHITYYISEGKKYFFNETDIKNLVQDFDQSTIKAKSFETKKGKIFNIQKIESTVSNLQDVLYENGFMFAQVDYELEFLDDDRVNIHYILKNSPRVYLDKIKIIGNTKTSDSVIRRELLVKEGDVYNITKLRRSIQRLNNLQYFENVSVDEKVIPGTSDRMEVTIIVKERSTASVSASIGFDQINGLSGNVGLQESNFLGEGYNAGISFERTTVSENYSLSFSDPYFKNKDLLLGFNAYYSQYGNPRFVAYNSRTSSLGFTAAYSITEYLRHSIQYRNQIDNISQNSGSVSPYIVAQIGQYNTSAISHTLMYDRRDNNFIPNEGYSFYLKQELAGFGGNVKFISNEIKMDWYHRIFNLDDLVIGFKGRIAGISSFGSSNVNVQNLYVLGGGFGLRGFNYRGVGPTLAFLNSDGSLQRYESFSYGGKNLQLFSTELRFPNALPKDLGLITYLFADVGTLYGIDNILNLSGARTIDERYYRMSVGLGVSWRSPMGPIGFAFGRTLRARDYDQKLAFLITFGGTGRF